jgi:putative ABC transport system permease protein
MVKNLRAALPESSLDIVTGSQITKEGQDSVRRSLSFFNTFLLVFALIALFVGSFLIFNTFSIVVAQRLRELALLRAVGASRWQIWSLLDRRPRRPGPARIEGGSATVLAADPTHINDLFDVGVVAGDITSLSAQQIAVSTSTASSKHLALGQDVEVTFPTTGTKHFTVGAIYKARELAGDYVLPLAAAQVNFPNQLDFQVYVKLAPGISLSAGRSALEPALAAYPTAKLLDRAEYKASQLKQIDQLLNLVYGLLGLALLIALIGIANTLGLAIHERTRELGLLRAVGMTRRQLRATVRYEALIVALVGAIEGLVVGIGLGWAIVRALHSQGITRLAVPGTALIVVTLLAGLAAVLAAVAPGRRAARLDILRAITAD